MGTKALSFGAALTLLSTQAWAQHSGGLREIKPGGETSCARGDDFSFFVYEGRSDKVIVDFIGGGACWNAETCAPESALFEDSVESVRSMIANGEFEGLYDKSNPANPLKDWTHVVIPYCTGDIHWGDSDVTYSRADGSSFEIRHRGAQNVHAVLAWMKDNLHGTRQLLATGCSAGSYGSIFWSPHLLESFPHARFSQFGDSGAGVLTQEFLNDSFPAWRVEQAAPSWIPGLAPGEVDWTKLRLSDLYTYIAQYYPEARWSQFNHAEDFVQKFFYVQMGGKPENWRSQMVASQREITANTPNYHYYVAPYDAHCASVYNDFYDKTSDGVKLTDWLSRLVDGAPPQNVTCDECEDAEESNAAITTDPL